MPNIEDPHADADMPELEHVPRETDVHDIIALPSERGAPDGTDHADLTSQDVVLGQAPAGPTDDEQPESPVIQEESTSQEDMPDMAELEEDEYSLNISDPYEYLQGLGTRNVGGVRKSFRVSKRLLQKNTLLAHKLTVRKALKTCATRAKPAILAELQQLLDKNTFEYVDKADLSKTALKKRIRSSMFLKETYDTFGNFVKKKAGLVADGDGQDKTIYDKLLSPTVSQEAVFMIIAIAAILKRKIVIVDVTGAYLECELPAGDEVYMRFFPV